MNEPIENIFTVHALGPAGPLKIQPVVAVTSAEAWAKATKEVEKIQSTLGMRCKLMAVVWTASDFAKIGK